jgi:nucleoside-diphosphate-sugar epimerase
MNIFVTGATGFIGSAVVKELIGAKHQVIGLARSEAGAKSLAAAGAVVHRGHLEDLESLRSGAAMADGVIHCAFVHDWSKFKESCEIDQRAIETLGAALAGTDRPLIVSSGIGPLAPGRLATEEMEPANHSVMPRVSEQTAMALRSKGVNVSVVRLPQIHDPVKQGLITYLVSMAREKGTSPYIGEGRNRWAAAHINDTARLYRLALEKRESGAKYHAVGEEGVSLRDIAETIGRGLKVSVISISAEEAPAYFGPFAMFAGLDMPASSAITQKRLGWNPTGPGLIADLERMDYFAKAATQS